MRRRAAVLALALASALLMAAPSFAQDAPRRIDWPALALVDGTTAPPSRWAGKPVVVVFWATWCTFCQRHNARLSALWRRGVPFELLGVEVDGQAELVRRTVAERGYDFPVAAGQAGLRDRFTGRHVVPMTCLVDAAGLVRQCIPGEMTEADIEDLAALRWARP